MTEQDERPRNIDTSFIKVKPGDNIKCEGICNGSVNGSLFKKTTMIEIKEPGENKKLICVPCWKSFKQYCVDFEGYDYEE